MIERALKNLKISSLNQMQKASMDSIYINRNTVIHSPTGSGKTLAFLLPVIKMIQPSRSTVQTLIIVPSRELALQIRDVHKAMQSGINLVCCYGGHSMEAEKESFKSNPAILVATPGRLASHIRESRFDFSGITTLVLDEFDKCLEMGFLDDMTFIIDNLKKLKKRVCISATKMDKIPDFVGMQDITTIEFSDKELQPDITLRSVESPCADKLQTLFGLIKYLGNQPTIVFCNHRDSVNRVGEFLQTKKIAAVIYHGAMDQDEREIALLKFRNLSNHVLVTTDLASRGLDIPEVQCIIHYHLPSTHDAYIHRNGRTARMNAQGTTYIILSPEESLPAYLPERPETENFSGDLPLPEKTEWVTVALDLGKRDKISKGDVVGFLFQKGRLSREELGIVEVFHKGAYAAVKRDKVKRMLSLLVGETLKRKAVRATLCD